MAQDPVFYENFVRNMYPSSIPAQPSPGGGSWDPHTSTSISEDEMQRQQMLMLLFKTEQPPTPDPSQSTFHIDWQGQEQDEANMPPRNGYYAPQSAASQSSAYPQTALSTTNYWNRQDLRPWDGIWRGDAQRGRRLGSQNHAEYQRPLSREERDRRRDEIEMGR